MMISNLKMINYDQLQLIKSSNLTINVSIINLNRSNTEHILRKIYNL